MKELLRKLIKIISYKNELTSKKSYVAWFNGCPIILTHSQLQTAINTSFLCTQDTAYLNLPTELHTLQMRRTQQKLGLSQSQTSGKEVEISGKLQ